MTEFEIPSEGVNNREDSKIDSDLSTAEFDRHKLLKDICRNNHLLSGVVLDCNGVFSDTVFTRFGSLTYLFDRGARNTQEDSLGFVHNENYISLIVADGLGGMRDGAKVSHAVTENCVAIANEQLLVQAIRDNSEKIVKGVSLHGATTLSVLDINKEGILQGAHAGDSPYWIIRKGEGIYQNKLHTLYELFYDEIKKCIDEYQNSNHTDSTSSTTNPYLITKENIKELVEKLLDADNLSDLSYRKILFEWAETLDEKSRNLICYRILNETEITKTISALSQNILEYSPDIQLQSGDIIILATDGLQPQGIGQVEGKPVLKLENLITTIDLCKIVSETDGDTLKIADDIQRLSRQRNGKDNLAMIVFKYESNETSIDGRWKTN